MRISLFLLLIFSLPIQAKAKVTSQVRCMLCGEKIVCGNLNKKVSSKEKKQISVKEYCSKKTRKGAYLKKGKTYSYQEIIKQRAILEEQGIEPDPIELKTDRLPAGEQNPGNLAKEPEAPSIEKILSEDKGDTKRGDWISPKSPNGKYMSSKSVNTEKGTPVPISNRQIKPTEILIPDSFRKKFCKEKLAYQECEDEYNKYIKDNPKNLKFSTTDLKEKEEIELKESTKTKSIKNVKKKSRVSSKKEKSKEPVNTSLSTKIEAPVKTPQVSSIGSSVSKTEASKPSAPTVKSVTPTSKTTTQKRNVAQVKPVVKKPKVKKKAKKMIDETDPEFMGPAVLKKTLKTPFSGSLEISRDRYGKAIPRTCESIVEWDHESYARLTAIKEDPSLKTFFDKGSFCRKENCSAIELEGGFSNIGACRNSLAASFMTSILGGIGLDAPLKYNCQALAEVTLIKSCSELYPNLRKEYFSKDDRVSLQEGLNLCRSKLDRRINDKDLYPFFAYPLVSSINKIFSCSESKNEEEEKACKKDHMRQVGLYSEADCLSLYEYLKLNGSKDRKQDLSKHKKEWKHKTWFHLGEYFYEAYPEIIKHVNFQLKKDFQAPETCMNSIESRIKEGVKRMSENHKSMTFLKKSADYVVEGFMSLKNKLSEGSPQEKKKEEKKESLDYERLLLEMETHRRLKSFQSLETDYCGHSNQPSQARPVDSDANQ